MVGRGWRQQVAGSPSPRRHHHITATVTHIIASRRVASRRIASRRVAQDVDAITGAVPDPADEADPARRAGIERSLAYMGLDDKVGVPLAEIPVDKVWMQHICVVMRVYL